MNEEAYSEEDEQLLAQMKEDFLDECRDLLDDLSLNLAKLEEHPDDQEVINEIFRAAHTIKGSASFVGLDQIREVAHKMEDVFAAIRDGKLAVDASVIDLFYQALNLLTNLRDKAAVSDGTPADIGPIVSGLSELAESGERPASRKPKKKKEKVAETALAKPRILEEAIKVKTEKLDELMNLISELITAKNRLNEVADASLDENLKAVASQINRTTNDMYGGIMKIRMVSLERLFNKFPGVVRNMARDQNRQIEFIIKGRETEVDKTVIDQLYDPLVHILRNAVDHGIEGPDRRQKLGKRSRGVVTLDAYHEHNNVLITVTDDGRGMNPADLREAAVKRGFITAEEAAAYTDEQALQLIFRPGFSTKKETTAISGRGVGMDVVNENIQKLRGTVNVKTEANKGTKFIVQLPLTLAILHVLLVKADEERYAVPIDSVAETLTLKRQDIKKMENREVIFWRGQALPLKKLAVLVRSTVKEKIGDDSSLREELLQKEIKAMVLQLADKRIAAVVDYLFGKYDLVVKPLGKYLGKVRGIEGASILADGSVALVLDTGDLRA